MIITKRKWDIIIGITGIVVDLLKLLKDKFKNGGGKKDDSTGSTKTK